MLSLIYYGGGYMTKEEIGQILKQLRSSCGMTQKEVAEKIGRKQQIVGHWETGYAQPDANTLFLLCEIYGTTVDKAFGFASKRELFSKKELSVIEKYRSLDPHGRETVDWILDRESIRVSELQEKSNRISELESPAMQADTNICRFRTINYYYRLASAGTGQIVFGTPPTKRIEIPDIPQYRKADYAIGVNGNSMEPVFSDGDMLLVEMADEIDPGEIGIFLVDNESYVKKLGHGELISLNPKAANIPLTENSKCMGRVLGTLGKG